MLVLFPIKTHFSHFSMWLRAGPGTRNGSTCTSHTSRYFAPEALCYSSQSWLELEAGCHLGNCRSYPAHKVAHCSHLFPYSLPQVTRQSIIPLWGSPASSAAIQAFKYSVTITTVDRRTFPSPWRPQPCLHKT